MLRTASLTLLVLVLAGCAWPQTQLASDTGNRAPCTSNCGAGGPLGSNWLVWPSNSTFFGPKNPGFCCGDGVTRAYYTGVAFPNDQWAQVDCSALYYSPDNGPPRNTYPQSFCGVVLRGNSGLNGYDCTWSDAYDDGHAEFWIGVWGSGGYKGDLAGNYTWNKKPGVIKCTIVGQTITMYMDGVQKLQATDHTYNYTAGYPGLDASGYTAGSGYGAGYATNWTAGSLSSPSALADAANLSDAAAPGKTFSSSNTAVHVTLH